MDYKNWLNINATNESNFKTDNSCIGNRYQETHEEFLEATFNDHVSHQKPGKINSNGKLSCFEHILDKYTGVVGKIFH